MELELAYVRHAVQTEPAREDLEEHETGPAAVAIAPAGYSIRDSSRLGRIRLVAGPEDRDAIASARDLAACLGARLTWDEPYVDFLLIASWPKAPPGRVLLTSQRQDELESATCPVLVLPREARIRFSPSVRMWVS